MAGEQLPPGPDDPYYRRLNLPSASSIKEYLEVVQASVVVLGLVLYGVVRISIEAFYRSLGTTPEEVGLGYLTSVTRAAIGVVTAGTLIVAYLFLMPWLEHLLQRYSGGTPAAPSSPSWNWATQSVIPLVLGGVSYLVFYSAHLTALMIAFALYPTAVALQAWYRTPRDRSKPILVPVLLLISLAGVIFAGYSSGIWRAEQVMAGHEVSSHPIFGVVPVIASCVRAIPTDGSTPPEYLADEGMMYLGQAESTLILYRSEDDELVRLPSGEAALIDRSC